MVGYDKVCKSLEHLGLDEVSISNVLNLIIRQSCILHTVQFPYRMFVESYPCPRPKTHRKQNPERRTANRQSSEITHREERLAKSVSKSIEILSNQSTIHTSNQSIFPIRHILSHRRHSIDRIGEGSRKRSCQIC